MWNCLVSYLAMAQVPRLQCMRDLCRLLVLTVLTIFTVLCCTYSIFLSSTLIKPVYMTWFLMWEHTPRLRLLPQLFVSSHLRFWVVLFLVCLILFVCLFVSL